MKTFVMLRRLSWLSLVVGLVGSFAAGSAHADVFETLVSYRCDLAGQRLVITYRGAYNEDGKTLLENAGSDAWSPWSLIRVVEHNETATRVQGFKVRRLCLIAGKALRVTISGRPGNANPLARCGAHASVSVRIAVERTVVFDEALEYDCTSTEIITDVVLIPSQEGFQVQVTKVRSDDFFR